MVMVIHVAKSGPDIHFGLNVYNLQNNKNIIMWISSILKILFVILHQRVSQYVYLKSIQYFYSPTSWGCAGVQLDAQIGLTTKFYFIFLLVGLD